ncbi:MAG TPA: hypothetical protein VF510_06860 [Ktedonobacterales bacterium]
MILPVLNFLAAMLAIVFGLGCALTALASLIYARSDHGFQRRLDIAYVLFAGFLAWGALSDSRQSFVYVRDPSISVAYPLYIALTFWALVIFAFLYISLRRFVAALRQLQ